MVHTRAVVRQNLATAAWLDRQAQSGALNNVLLERDWRVQYHAKPRRCQATTVAGRTTTKAALQSGHDHRSPTQNNRSGQRMAGFGRVRR
jgi:hypothetical protein